jgi:DNA invertase Pin-like site-specific DNA recombinase
MVTQKQEGAIRHYSDYYTTDSCISEITKVDQKIVGIIRRYYIFTTEQERERVEKLLNDSIPDGAIEIKTKIPLHTIHTIKNYLKFKEKNEKEKPKNK